MIKKLLLITVMSFTGLGLFGQSVTLELGMGVGAEQTSGDRIGKISLNAAIYRQFTDRLSFGLDLTAGGNFIPSDNSTVEGNTEILDPFGTQWTSTMVKAKYHPLESFPVYVAMHAGINSYWWNVNTIEEQRINRINFAVAPEVGIDLKTGFTMSMRYLLGGSTPEFTGNRGGNTQVTLDSRNVNILTFSLGYRIKLW